MKKKVLALLVSLLMVFTFQNVFARDKKFIHYDPAFDEIYDEVNEMPDEYAGAYYDAEGILHVIPCNAVPLTKNSDYVSLGIIYDDPEEYSLKELEDAFMILRANNKELELTAYGKNVMENCLDVYAVEWTEAEKNAVKELTGINKVNFYIDKEAANWVIDYNYISPNYNDFLEEIDLVPVTEEDLLPYMENINQDNMSPTPRKIFWLQYGSQILNLDRMDSDQRDYMKQTVGGMFKYRNSDDLLLATTAHGNQIGDRIGAYYHSSSTGWVRVQIGTVVDLLQGESKEFNGMFGLDVALIKFEHNPTSSYSIVPVNDNSNGDENDGGDGPRLGKGYWIDNPSSGGEMVYATCVDDRFDVTWSPVDEFGEPTSPAILFKKMGKYTFDKNAILPVGGDSGSPIMRIDAEPGGYFELAGIYKGIRNRDDPDNRFAIGSNSAYIEEEFNLNYKFYQE